MIPVAWRNAARLVRKAAGVPDMSQSSLTMVAKNARFSIGQLIHHRMFDYRGVIIDVDPEFQGSDEWYDQVALSRPPRDRPWYRVLVHNAVHETYVAERNLESDDSTEPVNHPQIGDYFDAFEKGIYFSHTRNN